MNWQYGTAVYLELEGKVYLPTKGERTDEGIVLHWSFISLPAMRITTYRILTEESAEVFSGNYTVTAGDDMTVVVTLRPI